MRTGRPWLVWLAAAATGLALGPSQWPTANAQTDPYRPGAFPPLSRAGDESPGDPLDILGVLRGLGLPDPDADPPPPELVRPRFLADPADPEGGDPIWTAPALAPASPSLTGEGAERKPRRVSNSSQGVWGALTASVVVNERPELSTWEEPLWKRTWKADQSWRYSVLGPVAVFGQLGANSEEAAQADMTVAARTGLACKVPVGGLAEVVLRGGPGVRYTDPLRPDRVRERSDLLFEVQARCPLLFGIGLEYQASALPALTPVAQDQLNQDLRLAFPVGSAGKFQFGARHRWASTPEARPWSDGMQLYLGLELAR